MLSDANIGVDGNSSDGTIVYRIVALDPDADDELSFALNSGNVNSAFAIDANTGEISVNDEDQLRHNFNQEFRLGVLVTDRNGLTAEATITVQILPADFVTITPLRGFSPNGDGINDFWVIEGIEDFPENSVKVFNRWGNVVFETQDYDNASIAWRGENNRDTFESTYYFIITVPDLKPITGYLVVKKG
jgi:gliding motility-associated-like protein